MFAAALLSLAVFLTFTTFPLREYGGSKKLRISAIAATAVVMLLTLTPAVFDRLVIKGDSVSPHPGPGIPLFGLLVFSLLGGGILKLLRNYFEAHGRQKDQLKYVLLGLAGTFSLIFLGNFLLVILFKNTAFVPLGPAFTLVFSISFAYAIVRHRLFDIRLLVARSVAYLLSLGTLILLILVSSYGISRVLFHGSVTADSLRVIYTVLAVGLALTFAPTKRAYDRLTNHIFYRDTYDIQTFLDNLNKILVSSYQPVPLLKGSTHVIEEYLKPTYCLFGIKETSLRPRRMVGSVKTPNFTEDDIEFVRGITPTIKKRLIVVDQLSRKHADLQEVLQKNNIAVIARLTTTVTQEGVGYLMLGPKKSGNIYNSQDIRVLEIIANELVIAVQNALRYEEIEGFNVTLQDKVTDATKSLRKANEKLKALDETKDDFISMASHQLRTPLTSIKGYISMVLEEDAGKISPMQKEMLGQAFFSSQRMVYLISDLLNVSRLKTGKFIIEPAKVNLANVVKEELGQLEETAAARKLKLVYDQPNSFPDLMLDETKTRQVIMNFVDNAIYYTPAGGTITVRLINNPSTIELRVEDNGIGVPKPEQRHLFTKFYRAGNARKARPDGTGLGLFMAKKVIVSQGGSILFESTEGKGSMFGFVFSKSRLSPSAANNAAPELTHVK
jgi:signal transduction histidine kinase